MNRNQPGALVRALFGAVAVVACSQNSTTQTVRALQSSGEVSFVCRSSDGEGRDIETCPQEHKIFSLVTQVATGEVAVVNAQTGQFTDVDSTIPGFTFLRVGGRPGHIVSTPGGVASFVGVSDLGREGIFALPTTCLGPPEEGEHRRDLTTWPACSLPVAPGEIAVLIAPPDADGKILDRCGDGAVEQGEPLAAGRKECSADLRDELNPPGRRKLAVALPELGQLAIIDAQELLDREPGSFDPCPIEVLHTLKIELPAGPIEQPVPTDLQGDGCIPASIPYPPPTEPFLSLPGGIALSEVGTLYVADRGAPVVHVLDVADPCQPLEMPPLLPVSFHSPQRVVTTRDVAVSPLTRAGQRFVYAIDELDQPSASLMAFDVSVGSASRTPIVRTGATRLPFEEVDRIRFNASVRDLQIVKHDFPVDDASGIGATGALCDPDPENTDETSPGVRYRTSPDYASGAGPRTIRGIFGVALLTNSTVSLVDIEDFDAPCRRPLTSNPNPVEDFRGCANDPDITFKTKSDGTPTVSNEVSCRVVQPHRARSAAFAVNSSLTGGNAPSLRGFPRLSLDQQDISKDPSDPPRILAVDFPSPTGEGSLPAQVYVGSKLFQRAIKGETPPDDELIVDPRTPARYSVTLPFQETRAYANDEIFTSTYEGPIASLLPTGVFKFEKGAGRILSDFGGVFCSRGVQDVRLTTEVGEQRFALKGKQLEKFAHDYADYVQVRSILLPETDSYWKSEQGKSCGGFNSCKSEFGVGDEGVFKERRELRILEAYQDRLVVEPRLSMSTDKQDEVLAKLDCCFPGVEAYAIRASKQWVTVGNQSGFRHQISPVLQVAPDGTADYVCQRDCDPRRRYFDSRAFELTSNDCNADENLGSKDPGACIIGRDPDAVICSYDDSVDGKGKEFGAGVKPTGPGSECIFENLNVRFAIYRGRKPSRRDMEFTWNVFGGFTPLGINLAQQLGSQTVLPQSMVYQPQLRRLVVVDGATMGVALIGLNSLRVLEGFL